MTSVSVRSAIIAGKKARVIRIIPKVRT